MRKYIFFYFALMASSLIFGQSIQLVTNQTLQIEAGKSSILTFGFAKGDNIQVHIEESGRKNNTTFGYKEFGKDFIFSQQIKNKLDHNFSIKEESIFQFSFENNSVTPASVKVLIQRLPSKKSGDKFNSSVNWVNTFDTTYVIENRKVVVYDTVYSRTEKSSWDVTLKEELIVEKSQKVSSTLSIGKDNYSIVSITLPEDFVTKDKYKKIASWAYWIGVGADANKQWNNNVKFLTSITKTVAGYYTTPLGALLLGQVMDMALPQTGEDVIYWVANKENYNRYLKGESFNKLDKGKGIATFKQLLEEQNRKGTFYFYLKNDNYLQDLNVSIKVVAIMETGVLKKEKTTDYDLIPREENRIFKIPVVTTKLVPTIQK